MREARSWPRRMVRGAAGVAAAGVLCVLGGCMDLSGRGPAPLAETVSPARQGYLRAGSVYCMRGWLGIFSTGMDQLAAQADGEVASVSVADEEWRRLAHFIVREHKAGRLHGPLVLVGHSFGADDQIRVADALQAAGIKVDLLVTIDPVTPPPVPSNVRRVLNIYKSHPLTDAIPAWRGVPIEQAAKGVPVDNIDLREADVGFNTEAIDHINIEKNPGVHQMVLQAIREACPLRTVWLREQRQRETRVSAHSAPANELPPPPGVSGVAALANQPLELAR